MPPFLQIGMERKTYLAFARDLNPSRSPQLLAVIAAWERTGSTSTPSQGQTQP